jgi:tRNA(Arg) A34 adenosine deaminase TadA
VPEDISPEQSSTPKPSWVREYEEGLESMAKDKEIATLREKLPGIDQIFEDLIAELPPQGKGSEFPVAAYVVKKGESGRTVVVARSQNLVNTKADSTSHAEMEALRLAQEIEGSKHLPDHYLLTTLEPCAMCCGAAVHTNVEGVVYALDHGDVAGKHALIDGEYKPWRTSPASFEAKSYLEESGLEVFDGFMKGSVDRQLMRYNTTTSYYEDPDHN